MSPLKALLFDVDGTLAETERDGHRVAFNRAFAEHGLDWFWDERLYGELLAITGGRERIVHYARRYRPEWLEQDGAELRITAIHRSKNRHFADLLGDGGIRLRPGLARWLDEARQAGLRLGIVTTTSRENLEALLAKTMNDDLASAFTLRVCGQDVTRKKPDPECYRIALNALGLPPTQVLAVEDSRNGLEAACGAGLRAVIVRSFYFRDERFDEAALVIDEFSELSLSALRQHIVGR